MKRQKLSSQCHIKSMNILLAIIQLLYPLIRTYVPAATYIRVFNRTGVYANEASSVVHIAHVLITATTEYFYQAKRMIRGLGVDRPWPILELSMGNSQDNMTSQIKIEIDVWGVLNSCTNVLISIMFEKHTFKLIVIRYHAPTTKIM